jgi:NAD(P)H-hydrate epimerase
MPSLLLMENAGRNISDVLRRKFSPCKVLLFVGKGNNGGDGLVIARYLTNFGFQSHVLLLTDPDTLKPDPQLNFRVVKKMGIPVTIVTETTSVEALRGHCLSADLAVDALFGVGIHSPLTGMYERAVRAMNQSKKPVISIDIPSGLDTDTGAVHGVAVKAVATFTLGLKKRGLCVGDGPAYAGEIEVIDLGIPRELLAPFHSPL